MADSSSGATTSSSVVELRTTAELDTATSAIFFHDGGANFSWPEAEKTTSKLTSQGALDALCDRYSIPVDYTPFIAAYGWVACRTPRELPNAICVYADALEAGMRLPLHEFYLVVLRHYGLAPSQLAPNSWRYMAGFVQLCRDAGVEPLLSVFDFFFSICAHGGNSLGWHHFKPYAVPLSSGNRRRPLFTGKMPGFADWKSRFFFLLPSSSATPWPCVLQWGKPSREAVRKPVETTATKTAISKLLDRAGDCGIDIAPFLSRRGLPLGQQAALHPHKTTMLSVKVEQADATVAAAVAAASAPTRKRKSPETAAPGVPAACGSPQGHAGASTPPDSSSSPLRQHSGDARSATRGRGLVDSITGALQLAQEAMAELEEKEQELQARRDEVRAARAKHAADVSQLMEEVRAARAEHASDVGRLVGEHQKAARAYADEIAQLKDEIEKAKAEHAAEMRAVKAKALRELISSRDESSSMVREFYAKGLKDMRQLAVTLYEGVVDLSELTTDQLLSNSGSMGLPSPQARPDDQ